jgi:sigma-E factor negative regulatory protein RseA
VSPLTYDEEICIGKAMNHKTTQAQSSELLSALADGQVRDDEVTVVLHACEQYQETAYANWNAYHLIGNVLRSSAAALESSEARFLERFNQRLAEELTIEPASALVVPPGFLREPAVQSIPVRSDASNDESFRWKLVAGFASLAAVAAIAWNATGFPAPVGGTQLAQGSAQQPVVVASPQGPMVRDARLEELLAAHRQLGGMSALQAPSGFLQNATFDTAQGARP